MVVSAEGRAEAEVVILGREELAEKVLFEQRAEGAPEWATLMPVQEGHPTQSGHGERPRVEENTQEAGAAGVRGAEGRVVSDGATEGWGEASRPSIATAAMPQFRGDAS